MPREGSADNGKCPPLLKKFFTRIERLITNPLSPVCYVQINFLISKIFIARLIDARKFRRRDRLYLICGYEPANAAPCTELHPLSVVLFWIPQKDGRNEKPALLTLAAGLPGWAFGSALFLEKMPPRRRASKTPKKRALAPHALPSAEKAVACRLRGHQGLPNERRTEFHPSCIS